jgi:hypothetical protein
METATVGSYLNALAASSKAANLQFDPRAAVADLAKQTGLAPKKLAALPVGELGDHLDVVGDPTAPAVVGRFTGTICVTSGGQTRCGNGPDVFDGMFWGMVVGGALGGQIGMIIGAIIGAIIGWLWGDGN